MPRRTSRTIIAALRLALRWPVEKFDRKLDDPERAQRETLAAIIKELSKTAYGQTHGIRHDDEYVEFRKKLPIADYEAFEPWLKAQMRLENQALAPGKVLFYEKTSGSSGPAKYIPYTAKLKRTMHRMFLLWLGDILNRGPKLKSGRTFISVSPPFMPEKTEMGVPLGVSDERSYLAGWTRRLIDRYFITLPNTEPFRYPKSFHVALCRMLLAAEDLEILSIWSPSYLLIILDEIVQYQAGLLRLLEQQGTPPQRLIKLRRAINKKEWTKVWPHLKLLSCWDSGHSRAGAMRLRELFPGVMVQGKGLLATEAPMTMPWIRANGAVPLIDEVFFEFEEAPGRVRLLHEIQPGREYSLILSQKGGLARYRIGDRVLVSYKYRNTPCLEFIGREGGVSDLVGEKLNESFVSQALKQLPLGNSRFHSLVPVRGTGLPHYLLLADAAEVSAPLLARQLDEVLSRSLRYREARFLGQLGNARVHLGPQLEKLTVSHFIKKGMKWGDVKSRALISDFDVALLAEEVSA